jgi:hypothetical protein
MDLDPGVELVPSGVEKRLAVRAEYHALSRRRWQVDALADRFEVPLGQGMHSAVGIENRLLGERTMAARPAARQRNAQITGTAQSLLDAGQRCWTPSSGGQTRRR